MLDVRACLAVPRLGPEVSPRPARDCREQPATVARSPFGRESGFRKTTAAQRKGPAARQKPPRGIGFSLASTRPNAYRTCTEDTQAVPRNLLRLSSDRRIPAR